MALAGVVLGRVNLAEPTTRTTVWFLKVLVIPIAMVNQDSVLVIVLAIKLSRKSGKEK